jgi:hypothetical protein
MTHLNVNGNENESNNVKNMKKNDSDRFRQSAMISSNLSRVNNNKSKSNLDSASINNSQSKYSNNNSNKLQN